MRWGALVNAVVAVRVGAGDGLTALTGSLLWVALPSLIIFALMAGLAVLLHPAPYRYRAGRHALAALAIPVVAVLLGLVLGFAQGSNPLGSSRRYGVAGEMVVAGWSSHRCSPCSVTVRPYLSGPGAPWSTHQANAAAVSSHSRRAPYWVTW